VWKKFPRHRCITHRFERFDVNPVGGPDLSQLVYGEMKGDIRRARDDGVG
jgi:hypothetical protein